MGRLLSYSLSTYSPTQSKVLPSRVPEAAGTLWYPVDRHPTPTSKQVQAFQLNFPTAIVIHTHFTQGAESSPAGPGLTLEVPGLRAPRDSRALPN